MSNVKREMGDRLIGWGNVMKALLIGVILVVLLTAVVSLLGINGSATDDGTIIVSWDANKEADLAGYKIYYGNQSVNYTTRIDVGNIIEYVIDGLPREKFYYLAVTAYDTAQNESPYSEQVVVYLSKEDTGAVQLNFNYYNFPNPFNPNLQHTFIRYLLKESKLVSIVIYDPTEQVVRKLVTESLEYAGEHIEPWDGRYDSGAMVANGVYYAVIQLDSERHVVQMVVVR